MTYDNDLRGLAEYAGDLRFKCYLEQTGTIDGEYSIEGGGTEEGTLFQIQMEPFVPRIDTFAGEARFAAVISFPELAISVWTRKKQEEPFPCPGKKAGKLAEFLQDPDEDSEEASAEPGRDENEQGTKVMFTKIPAARITTAFRKPLQDATDIADFVKVEEQIKMLIEQAIDEMTGKMMKQFLKSPAKDFSGFFAAKAQEGWKINTFSDLEDLDG